MKPEHHQQIRAWIGEEIAALRARGATDADMQEEAFIALVGVKILEHHWDEIHADSELSKALITKGLRTASPETLRQQASLSRERGNADLAYYLEELADDRWREPKA
jgi:propanediol dehydratase small subunit